MERTQQQQREEALLERYAQARSDLRSGREAEIARAREVFLSLGDFKTARRWRKNARCCWIFGWGIR